MSTDDIWGLSDGSNAASSDGVYQDNFGKLIPNGTMALAMITEADWKVGKESGNEYFSATWEVVKPESLANRKVWQMLHVNNDKKEFRDSQRKKFATIDYNAGGKLAKKGGKPTGDELAVALVARPMVIEIREVRNRETGEWRNEIGSIYPKDTPTSVGVLRSEGKSSQRPAQQSQRSSGYSDLDDEIPF